MKKFFLLFILILAIGGCSDSSEKYIENTIDYDEEILQEENTKPIEDKNINEDLNSIENNKINEKGEEEKTSILDPDIRNDIFYNNKTIIRYVYENQYFWGILSDDGSVFPINNLSAEKTGAGAIFTEFIDGKMLISPTNEYDNSQIYFLTEDGKYEKVFEENPNITYRILDWGDGYYMIRQDIRSIDENQSLIGILNHDGQWILEPCNIWGEIDEINFRNEDKIGYLNEGMFFYNGILYNCAENIYVDLGKESRMCGHFKNGNTILKIENSYYRVSNTGETSKLFDLEDSNVYASEDRFIVISQEYVSEKGKVQETIKGTLYDLEGNTLSNFQNYNLVYHESAYYFNENGIAYIMIKGADNNTYITFINESGEFLFDPIMIASWNGDYCVSKISEGKVLTATDYEEYSIVDENGNIQILDFSDWEVPHITEIDINSSAFENGKIVVNYEPETYQNYDFIVSDKGEIILPSL